MNIFNRSNAPQNDHNIHNIASNAPTATNAQEQSLFSRFCRALSPAFASRQMGETTNSEHLQNIESLASAPGTQQPTVREKSIAQCLRDWLKDAPAEQKDSVKEAIKRINKLINGRNDYNAFSTLDLSKLALTSLPKNVFQRIPLLSTLDLGDNQLTEIDLRGCNKILALYCQRNELAQLNLQDCHALSTLNCHNNQLQSLELSGCPNLGTLSCAQNQLQSLELSGCPKLDTLICGQNQLQSLELSGCPKLHTLHCIDNQLTSLDVSHCHSLRTLHAADNPNLTQLTFRDNIRSLRVLSLLHTRIRWWNLPESIRALERLLTIDIPQEEFNGIQSTHTASVNNATLNIAKKLETDNPDIDIEQAYSALESWVEELPTQNAAIARGYANDDFKNKTAQEWVNNPEHIDAVLEGTSDFTVKKFLALAWTAIQDTEQREPYTSLDDAQLAIRDTLYEIRRGDNLNGDHKPKDNNGLSLNICAGGTFNKITEKLVSVVKGASFTMITKTTFILALNSTIQRAAKKAIDNTPELAESLISNDGLLTEAIWQVIEPQVREEVLAEFKAETHIGDTLITDILDTNTSFEGILQYLTIER